MGWPAADCVFLENESNEPTSGTQFLVALETGYSPTVPRTSVKVMPRKLLRKYCEWVMDEISLINHSFILKFKCLKG